MTNTLQAKAEIEPLICTNVQTLTLRMIQNDSVVAATSLTDNFAVAASVELAAYNANIGRGILETNIHPVTANPVDVLAQIILQVDSSGGAGTNGTALARCRVKIHEIQIIKA